MLVEFKYINNIGANCHASALSVPGNVFYTFFCNSLQYVCTPQRLSHVTKVIQHSKLPWMCKPMGQSLRGGLMRGCASSGKHCLYLCTHGKIELKIWNTKRHFLQTFSFISGITVHAGRFYLVMTTVIFRSLHDY